MGYSAGEDPATVLLLACPKTDLEAAHALCLERGCAEFPAGGGGDLRIAPFGTWLFIVDVDLDDEDSPRPAARWRAQLGGKLPLDAEQFYALLPSTWMARHPEAYERARASTRRTDDDGSKPDRWERQWELDGEPVPEEEATDTQVFLPVSELESLSPAEWIFTNEVVPKQARRGRRFLPRTPTLVQLPK
jgi:hypothetical protein